MITPDEQNFRRELRHLWGKYKTLTESNELSMFSYTKQTEWGSIPSAEGFLEWVFVGCPTNLEELQKIKDE